MKLTVIIASTRPGRIGDQIGHWIADYASRHSDFEVSIADLAEVALPIFDEPAHPRLGVYQHEHTKRWSGIVDAADAFVVVTPEYNYTMPPALLNAADYLHREWKYKPMGFVGYGGAGAARAIQTEKLLFVGLGVMPIPPAVNLMGVYAPLAAPFGADERQEQAAKAMLDELHVWASALLPLHRS